MRQLFSQRNNGLAHKARHNLHEAEPDSLSRPEHPSQLKSLHSVKLPTEDHFSLKQKLLIGCLYWIFASENICEIPLTSRVNLPFLLITFRM